MGTVKIVRDSIPSNFVEYKNNCVNLGSHKLIYSLVGWRQGRSEHTSVYRQKITIIADGKKRSRIYTQRGDESCKYTMYDNYFRLCREIGVEPAKIE